MIPRGQVWDYPDHLPGFLSAASHSCKKALQGSATGSRKDLSLKHCFSHPFVPLRNSSLVTPSTLSAAYAEQLPVGAASCGSLGAQERASFGRGEQVAEPEGSLTFRVGSKPGLGAGNCPGLGPQRLSAALTVSKMQSVGCD